MDQSAAQQKIEATSENDVASSHSNGCEAQVSASYILDMWQRQ